MRFNPAYAAMLRYPSEHIGNHEEISAIIFDFGGVLCDIDVALTENAFRSLGVKSFDARHAVSDSQGLFARLETGRIADDDFFDALKPYFPEGVARQQLEDAWNALLLDVPAGRVALLRQLRHSYPLFLLSNSNRIHYRKYQADLVAKHGFDFGDLFDNAFFSFDLGLKKPDPEIFRKVTQIAGLDPARTLFIDDTLVHVDGAVQAGLIAFHLDLARGMQVTDLFIK